MADKSIIFISVVRDFAMYDRLVRENPSNAGAEFVAFDNNAENKTMSVRYNSFLDSYDYSKEAWFVFCHEDFQLLEPLSSKLKLMDAAALYGPIGRDLDPRLIGSQINSNRDGSGKRWIGVPFRKVREVQTLDCQCMIVHSSLIAKHKLRFDENLTFDLYVEDFCINAKVNHGITTKVLPILSWHHSFGEAKPRFFKQLAYLNTKYSNVEPAVYTTTGVLIGSHQARLRARMDLFKAFKFERFFHIKYTGGGRMVVKLFGLKIWQGFKRKYKEVKRRSVLLVSHDFSCTGAPLALLELAKRLKKMGFTPTLVCPSHGPLEESIRAAGFAYKVVREASLKGHDTKQEQKAFADFVSGFKLVILNTLAASLWIKTFRSRGTKVILWAHEGEAFLDFWKNKVVKISKWLPLFDRILCVSEYAASAVRWISRRKLDIEICPYGLPDRADDAAFGAAGPSDRIRCVVGGSIEPRKGQDVLIDALLRLEAHELERLDVVIAGRETSGEIVEKIDGCGLSCVKRVAALPQDEWLRLVAQSDVLICPSRDDPMPVVATEAMMFSKVVLVSDHTGTASLLEDGVSGFVVPADDSQALALAIRRAMAMRGGFAEIGRRARRVYEENFTIEAFDGNIRKFIC